ncbi:MAG TPA: glutathione S-transferase family protein [Phenylobacterium sp.]|nr:glutathione S-transferase family protein [Phenylobacterium sp.]
MSNDLVFYTHPMSRGRIVRWMLEEVGQPYRTELLDFGTSMKGPEFLAINPMGKVPALRHGETVITESAAICAYLADAFPDAGLAPASGSVDRGAYYRWLFFAAGPLEAAVAAKSMGFDAAGDQTRSAGWGDYATVVEVLERALADLEFVAGARFTAADLYLSSHVGWGMFTKTLPETPVFQAYVTRCQSRPAHQRAVEIDDALIPTS